MMLTLGRHFCLFARIYIHRPRLHFLICPERTKIKTENLLCFLSSASFGFQKILHCKCSRQRRLKKNLDKIIKTSHLLLLYWIRAFDHSAPFLDLSL